MGGSVRPRATVRHDKILIGEVAPRGQTTNGQPGNFSGMVPLRFIRALYCVDGSLHPLTGTAATVRGCPATAAASKAFPSQHPGLFHATGFAIHPYPQGQVTPNVPTSNEPDYADLPKLPNLEATLDGAVAAYGQSTKFPIYDTEFGYQTNPPEKIARAINPTLAAYYMNWAEYISWHDPRVASWDQYLLTDPPPPSNFDTGLQFANGQPKDPMQDAFRMPLYLPQASGKQGQALEVWGDLRPAHYAMAGLQGARGRRHPVQALERRRLQDAAAGHGHRCVRLLRGAGDVPLERLGAGRVVTTGRRHLLQPDDPGDRRLAARRRG